MAVYSDPEIIMQPLLKDECFLNVNGNVNIYSLAVVEPSAGSALAFLATANKLYNVTSNEDGELIEKEIEIPCLPSNGSIISISAYVDHFTGELHYAFTTSLRDSEDDISGYSIHIHREHQSCHEVTLHSLPYQLYHTAVPAAAGEQDVWVITGPKIVVIGPVQQSDTTHDGLADETDPNLTSEHHSKSLNDSEQFDLNTTAKNIILCETDTVNNDKTRNNHGEFESEKLKQENLEKTSAANNCNNSHGISEKIPPPPLLLSNASVSEQTYEHLRYGEFFPELSFIDFRVIKVDMLRTPDDSRRITAVCGEDGTVAIFDVRLRCDKEDSSTLVHPDNTSNLSSSKDHHSDLSDCDESKDLSCTMLDDALPRMYKAQVTVERRFKFEHAMSSVAIFSLTKPCLPYPEMLPHVPGVRVCFPELRTPFYDLLATSTIDRSHVFRAALYSERSVVQPLPGSSQHDSVLCCLPCHLTGDRRLYLLLGTYGQSILVYKAVPAASPNSSGAPYDWALMVKVAVGAPVLSLAFADIAGDGVKRLIVLTAGGIQTMVLEVRQTARVIAGRLLKLLPDASTPRPHAPCRRGSLLTEDERKLQQSSVRALRF